MVDDISNGNLLLKNWYGSTSYYLPIFYQFTIIPYIIFESLDDFLMYYQTMLVVDIMLAAYILVLKYSKDKIISTILFDSILIVLPSGSQVFISLFNYVHHTEAYLMMLLNLLIIKKILDEDTDKKLVIKLCILMYFVSFSLYTDGITKYVYTIPMIIILIYNIIMYREKYKFIVVLFVILLGEITNKIIETLLNIFGGITHSGYAIGSKFSDIDKWPEK